MSTAGGAALPRRPRRRAGAVTLRRPGGPTRPLAGTGRTAVAAVGLGLAVIGLAACGGGTKVLPVATVVSKVNAICGAYSARMETLAAPSFAPASVTAAELGKASAYLDKAVPLLRQEQASIKAVGEPRADQSLYDSVLSALAAQVRDESAARAAARDHNMPAFHLAVLADQSDSIRLAGMAQQFGLNSCLGGE